MSTFTTILFTVSLIMTLTPINAYVPIRTMGPLVAISTYLLPIIKFNYTIHSAILVNPCFQIENGIKPKIFNPNYTTEMDICTREYDEQITKYLNQQCSSEKAKNETQRSFTNHNHRRKRQMAMPVNAIVSYGILSKNQLWEQPISAKDIKQIENQIETIIEKIKGNNAQGENYKAKLIKTMNKTWYTGLYQSQILNSLLSEIKFTKDDLRMLVESSHGRMVRDNNHKYIFENNPLETKDVSATLWTPYECNFTDNNVLSIPFEVPIVHKEAKIVQLDPFKIIATAKNNKKCLMKYVGKKHLLVNLRTDCVRYLFEEPSYTTRLVPIVFDNYPRCIQHDIKYRNQWEAVECDEKSRKWDIIQIKSNNKEIFIYCYGHQLRVEGHETFECKNIIYAIPSETSFWIDGIRREVSRPNFDSEFSTSSEIIHMINRKMIHPQIDDYKGTIDLNAIVFDDMKIDQEILREDILRYQTTIFVLTIIAFLLLVVLICICLPKCPLYRRMRDRMLKKTQAGESFDLNEK